MAATSMLSRLISLMLAAAVVSANNLIFSQVSYEKSSGSLYTVRCEVVFKWDYYDISDRTITIGGGFPILWDTMDYYIYTGDEAVERRDSRFQDVSVRNRVLRMEVSDFEEGEWVAGVREFEVDVAEPVLFTFKACCRPTSLENVSGRWSPLVLQAWIDPAVEVSNAAQGFFRNAAVVDQDSYYVVPTLLEGGSASLSPEESSGLTSSAPSSFDLNSNTNEVHWTPTNAGMYGVSLRLSVPGSEAAFTTVTYITTVRDERCPAPYDDCVPVPVVTFLDGEEMSFLQGSESSYGVLADAFVPGLVELQTVAELPAGATLVLTSSNELEGTAFYTLTWSPAEGQESGEVCFVAHTDTDVISRAKFCADLNVSTPPPTPAPTTAAPTPAPTPAPKQYKCYNNPVPVISPPNPLLATDTCVNQQTWEPWACLNKQSYVALPIPAGLPLENPLPGNYGADLYQLGVREKLRALNFENADVDLPTRWDDRCNYDVKSRRFRGQCNNDGPEKAEGSVNTPFARNTPHAPQPEAFLTPNPRSVSNALMKRDEGFIPNEALNLLTVGWIQFNIHDWFNHEVLDVSDDPLVCPLGFGSSSQPDPEVDAAGMTEFKVGRTGGFFDTGVYHNTETHWWDGSQIYGTTWSQAMKLRRRNMRVPTGPWNKRKKNLFKCEMKIRRDGTIKMKSDGTPKVAFDENHWVGLTMFHNIFLREHNTICSDLRAQNQDWHENRLYHTARKIVVGMIAKIHTLEWTLALLDNPQLQVAMNVNWYGGLAVGLPFDIPALKGNPRLPVGVDAMGDNKTFAMTEEFVSVYRMHQLLPDEFKLRHADNAETVTETRGLREVLTDSYEHIRDTYEQEDLWVSLGLENPGKLTLNNYPEGLRHIPQEDGGFLDLATVEIMRDRERGVPRYNEFRRGMQLKPIETFEELTDNPKSVAALKELYNDVEEIDLQVGLMGEQCRPEGFHFSESAFQVFILMASSRLGADGFFTDKWTPEYYTTYGLQRIETTTLKTLITRHFPEIADFVPDNAFKPWSIPNSGL